MKEISKINPINVICGHDDSDPRSTLHELFADRTFSTLNAIALEYNDEKNSYHQLEKKINQIANYLYSAGLRPGQVIVV